MIIKLQKAMIKLNEYESLLMTLIVNDGMVFIL